MRIEVRCCCQPKKLLGWLTVPDARYKAARFPLMVKFGKPYEEVNLPIAQINCEVAGVMVSYRAIKAEGAPLEVLRRIRGFEEA